jgi:hypothetical protein
MGPASVSELLQKDETFDPVAAGILLGLANTLVCAVGLSVVEPSRDLGVAIMVFGFLPAMLIGALEGGIARLTRTGPRWVRLLLLAPIPLLFVLVLADGLFGSRAYGVAIPTVVAMLILERSSRAKPLVPQARVS